jgi:hypothetical protein
MPALIWGLRQIGAGRRLADGPGATAAFDIVCRAGTPRLG